MREADAIGATARQEFGPLTPAQLNWKPDAREWSVGQCLDHLIIATSGSFPTLRAIQAGTKQPTGWERLPLLSGLFVPILFRALDPERGRRVQAPAALHPAESAIDASIVDRLDETQRHLVAFMAAATPAALRTVVTSPAARFITYSLLDAYRIIVVHDHLHLRQARDVAASAGFPRPVTTR